MKLYNNELLIEANTPKRPLVRLSEITGLSINTIKDALDGKPSVSLVKLKTLADYFEVDWSELFDVPDPGRDPRLST